MTLDLSAYRNRLGWRNQLGRALWGIAWLLLYRPSPRPLHGWRRLLLRCFGARVGRGAHPYPSARIWAPSVQHAHVPLQALDLLAQKTKVNRILSHDLTLIIPR